MLKKTQFFQKLLLVLLITLVNLPVFALTIDDQGKINATDISQIVHVQSESESDIIQALKNASKEHLPISIMGKQHSQGGHTLAPKAIALNMLAFDRILDLDVKNKRVTVQSGITWAALQQYLNPYNLSISTMQSPNIFTVGGSLSVNAHGDDFRIGSVGKSIVAFHLLLANGEKVFVSPSINHDLWNAVRGGYGLFGVITDITLQLVDNHLLVAHYHETNINDFLAYFKKEILENKNTVLFYAHLNIVPGQRFLKDMYVITYTDTHILSQKPISLINPDKWNFIVTPLFNLSRYGTMGKRFRWFIEKIVFQKIYNDQIVSRNNAMEKPVHFASDYQDKESVDWLQEYFIPIDKIALFIATLRDVVQDNNINLLNLTIRYVPQKQIFYCLMLKLHVLV